MTSRGSSSSVRWWIRHWQMMVCMTRIAKTVAFAILVFFLRRKLDLLVSLSFRRWDDS